MKQLICPWILAQDSREQLPWLYENVTIGTGKQQKLLVLDRIVKKLDAGDYSIVGMEDRITVERKSVIDLCGTIGRGRERFIRELTRMAKLEWSAVVIEDDWYNFLKNPPPQVKIKPSAINGSIISFQQRFPSTHWIWGHDRFMASKQAWKILQRFWEDHHDD